MINTAQSREAAQRLLDTLPSVLPSADTAQADAVLAALTTSGLLGRTDRSEAALVAASRDALTSLAHLLDPLTADHGGARLMYLVGAVQGRYTPHPPADGLQARVGDAAAAVLVFAEWHMDDPEEIVRLAVRVHAEEASWAAAQPAGSVAADRTGRGSGLSQNRSRR